MGSPSAKSSPNLIVALLAAAGIVVSLMQTLVIPLAGRFPQLLNTSASNASWVITVTLLSGAVMMPVLGRLGDLYGKRRILLLCIGFLIAGSVLCALANSLVPMIFGRALQGMAGGVIPLGISTMRDVLPAERLGSAIALMSSSLGVGGALGLPIGAAIVENTDWHVLFWASAVLGVIIGALITLLVPPPPPTAVGRFDFPGAIGLAVGLTCLFLVISKGADWGWTSSVTLGLFAAAVVVLLLWGVFELRTSDPLVDLRTTARRQVLMTNIASIVVGFGMFAQSLVAPQLMQLPESTGYGLGQSLLATGLWMAPAGLMMTLISPLGARLSARSGPKVSLITGALIIAFGYLLAQLFMGHPAGLLLTNCVTSGGVAFAYGAMPALIMAAVPKSETAAANAFNTLMRSIGTTTSSAVIGAILAHMSQPVGGTTIPTEAGFRVAFLVGAVVVIVAAVLSLGIPGRKPEPEPATPEPENVRLPG